MLLTPSLGVKYLHPFSPPLQMSCRVLWLQHSENNPAEVLVGAEDARIAKEVQMWGAFGYSQMVEEKKTRNKLARPGCNQGQERD